MQTLQASITKITKKKEIAKKEGSLDGWLGEGSAVENVPSDSLEVSCQHEQTG